MRWVRCASERHKWGGLVLVKSLESTLAEVKPTTSDSRQAASAHLAPQRRRTLGRSHARAGCPSAAAALSARCLSSHQGIPRHLNGTRPPRRTPFRAPCLRLTSRPTVGSHMNLVGACARKAWPQTLNNSTGARCRRQLDQQGADYLQAGQGDRAGTLQARRWPGVVRRASCGAARVGHSKPTLRRVLTSARYRAACEGLTFAKFEHASADGVEQKLWAAHLKVNTVFRQEHKIVRFPRPGHETAD